jgi:hypothetical protein
MAARELSIGFIRHGDARKPVTVRVEIQDEEADVITSLDLTEHQWALVLSGSVITVEEAKDRP